MLSIFNLSGGTAQSGRSHCSIQAEPLLNFAGRGDFAERRTQVEYDPIADITNGDTATLSTELCEVKDNYHLGKLERTLAKVDLLILDELSYLSFNRHQSELLFKVISDRSEKSSTIVTTNLPFSKWTDLFENTTMVAAMIDRLTFSSHVLDMSGDSYRLKVTMQNKGGPGFCPRALYANLHL